MNKLERISAVLVRLQSRSVVTAQEMADQFGVSLRTIYRDIRVLEESGIPITGEAGQGYSLVDGFKLPPLMFTTQEAIAFLMAEKLVNRHTDGDTYDSYRSGMDKIRAVLRTSEREIVEDFDKYVYTVKNNRHPLPESDHILAPLLHCTIRKRKARIEYFANYNREVTMREIDPIGIYFITDNWYLLAWCHLRQDYRTFNASRIRSITPTEKTFEKKHPPMKSIIKDMHEDNTSFYVRIKVEKSALRNIGNVRYVMGLIKEEEKDLHVIQHYESYSLEHFGRWFLSFADKASILEPVELKTIVKELIHNIRL